MDTRSSSPEVFFSDWEPTPPRKHDLANPRTGLQDSSSTLEVDAGDANIAPKRRKTIGSAERLRAIQEALSGAPLPPLSNTVGKKHIGSKERLQAIKEALESCSRSPDPPKVLVIPPKDEASDRRPKEIASVFLSQEQQKLLGLVVRGESLFYTGSAGTGKSILLKSIMSALKRKYAGKPGAVAVTASTGLAACNIGGVTLHNWSAVGLGTDSVEDLVRRIKKNKKQLGRWLNTYVLIADEISMTDGDLFQKLFDIAMRLRTKGLPFGGIQVIVTGDFFQLPPVVKGNKELKFAFESAAWTSTFKRSYKLTQVFRQSDSTFVDMLNEIRHGELSQSTIATFQKLSRNIVYEDGILPTELYACRENVDAANASRMSKLKTEEKIYQSRDGGMIQDAFLREKLLKDFMAPAELALRVGAQVMLIKNLDEDLVNGSLGRVLRFVDPVDYDPEAGREGASASTVPKMRRSRGMEYPVVEFLMPNGDKKEELVMPETWKVEADGEVRVSRVQLPLLLAWALSIHKSQGQTLPRVKIDLSRVFEAGQAYVALSRATSVDGLQVQGFDPQKIRAHPKVVEWYKSLSTVE